ncbi:MAG: hypothetical protein A2W00_06300 [Candidatus Eisenbacteria bacterium RBG_16_71_46]|nr:MAG: hypothetical protein A2W00_06300 [Candidatus Eisenbacteria bacterium RBG_16_71_46]
MLSWLAYLIADLVSRALPARAVDGLAVALARVAFALRLPARRALAANLERLLPGTGTLERRALARAAFEQFALSLGEFLRLDRMAPGRLAGVIEVRGIEHLAAARASGRGVILLSAHLGNWEWGAAFLGAEGKKIHLVARPHPSPLVEAFFARRRRAWGVSSLSGSPLWRDAARALRRREWVALMSDRGTHRRTAPVCAWAAALARRTGALVLPGVMVRIGAGRYAACFGPPLSPEACRRGDLRSLRPFLERYPGQWCAFEPLPEGLA